MLLSFIFKIGEHIKGEGSLKNKGFNVIVVIFEKNKLWLACILQYNKARVNKNSNTKY